MYFYQSGVTQTLQCVGLSATSPGNNHTDGPKANHALSFDLDHSNGAAQLNVQVKYKTWLYRKDFHAKTK